MQPTQRSAQKIREEVLRKLCHNVPFLLRFAKNEFFYGCFLWFELLNFYFLPFVLVMNLSQNKLEQKDFIISTIRLGDNYFDFRITRYV